MKYLITAPDCAIKNSPGNRWNFLLAGLAIAVILYSIYGDIHRVFHSSHHYDFYDFYEGARALLSGTYLYRSGFGGYIYPPFFAFTLTPLAHYSEKFAHLVWLGVDISLLILILMMGFRILASGLQLTYNRWQAIGACSLTILLSYDQLRWNLIHGQTNLLILAGFVFALYWLDRKPVLAGIVLGLISNIKYQALFFLPFLLLRARWRMAIGLVAGAVTAALAPALMIGWRLNLDYLLVALRGITSMTNSTKLPVSYAAKVPKMLWKGNISISSSVTRFFLDHGWSKDSAYLFVLALACLIFLLLWWMFKRQGVAFIWRTPPTLGNPQQEKIIINLEWCAMLLCMLILSPQCTRLHLILLLNFNLFAVVMLWFPRAGVKSWPVLAGILISQFTLIFPSAWLGLPNTAWDYYGGPCWGLLIFLLLVINGALAYYRDVYKTPSTI